jgi:hypothetical protein
MTGSARLSRVVQALIALLVIGLAIRYLMRNWAEFKAQPLPLEFHAGWLLAALLTILATFALLIEAWRRVVLSQGETLAPLAAARIWTVASLGKYLPGKVWAIAGAAILAEQAGVRKSVAVTAALVLQALALASGVLVIAIAAPGSLVQGGETLIIGTVVLGGLALAGIAILCSTPALGWVQSRFPVTWPRLAPLRVPVALAALVANAVAWSAYGASLVFLARGLMPTAVPGYSLAVSVFTVSYLVGLVALLAPAGVGARESLFILLLSGPLGPKAAVGLAVASRILLTLTELGAALPFFLWRQSPQASSTRTSS